MKLNELQDGDIIITLNHPDNFKALGTKNSESLNALDKFASHIMIYKDSNLYHSTSGIHVAGVTQHQILNYLNTGQLGKFVVVRLQDSTVGKEMAELAIRWHKHLNKEELLMRPMDEFGRFKLTTAFSFATDREEDDPDKAQALELYRAFRANERNLQQPESIPLSKDKGVSCHYFVSACLKSALINKIFTKEWPKDIFEQYEKIKHLKGLHRKKLSQIDFAEFEKFANLVKDFLIHNSKENALQTFSVLSLPLKGKDIDAFCQFLAQHPTLFHFEGAVFKKKMHKEENFCIIDAETLGEISKKIKNLPFVIDEEALKQFEMLEPGTSFRKT